MTHTHKTRIPFQGFYNSIWDMTMESALEEFCTDEDGDIDFTMLDRCYSTTPWQSLRLAIAEEYVKRFALALLAEDVLLSLTFSSLYSPREYNFETDIIVAKINAAGIMALVQACEYSDFVEVLQERHTSYDGFSSFYSNDPEEWLKKPFSEWDSIELESLLIATCRSLYEAAPEMEEAIWEDMRETIYNMVDGAIDWERMGE